MFQTVTRILRLEAPAREIKTGPGGPDPQHLELLAYAPEFLLAGLLPLDAHRMTDLLNASDELELIDPLVQWLADGRVLGKESMSIPRSALVAVKAGSPRGDQARRHPTRQVAVGAGSGMYLMHGYLHVRRGGDPAIDLGRRPPVIPLTDATIRFAVGRDDRIDEADTLIVNRDVVDWIRPLSEEEFAPLVDRSLRRAG
jgi:hypothetical protein